MTNKSIHERIMRLESLIGVYERGMQDDFRLKHKLAKAEKECSVLIEASNYLRKEELKSEKLRKERDEMKRAIEFACDLMLTIDMVTFLSAYRVGNKDYIRDCWPEFYDGDES